jgi:hypothetical protein
LIEDETADWRGDHADERGQRYIEQGQRDGHLIFRRGLIDEREHAHHLPAE